MAEGPSNGTIVIVRNNRANRFSAYMSRIPLAELIEFPPAMTQAQLQEIPKVTITKEHTDSLTQCTVCFDEFKLNEGEIRKLPCNHMYHERCIFRWLETNPSCPACRAPLPNTNDNIDLEDVIRQHYDRLTADLFRHIAESQGQLPPLSVTINAHNWPVAQPRERQAPEEESTAARTRRHEMLPGAAVRDTEVVRDVPRRAAALRARSAIQQIYRQRTGNAQTRGRVNELTSQNGPHNI